MLSFLSSVFVWRCRFSETEILGSSALRALFRRPIAPKGREWRARSSDSLRCALFLFRGVRGELWEHASAEPAKSAIAAFASFRHFFANGLKSKLNLTNTAWSN